MFVQHGVRINGAEYLALESPDVVTADHKTRQAEVVITRQHCTRRDGDRATVALCARKLDGLQSDVSMELPERVRKVVDRMTELLLDPILRDPQLSNGSRGIELGQVRMALCVRPETHSLTGHLARLRPAERLDITARHSPEARHATEYHRITLDETRGKEERRRESPSREHRKRVREVVDETVIERDCDARATRCRRFTSDTCEVDDVTVLDEPVEVRRKLCR